MKTCDSSFHHQPTNVQQHGHSQLAYLHMPLNSASHIGRARHRWNINTKMDLEKTEYLDVVWIHLSQQESIAQASEHRIDHQIS
jgi:hypothetical protein